MSSFVGTPTIAERLHDENILWRAIAKRVAYTLRVALPGVITKFDPVTQLCTVQVTITENIILNEVSAPVQIPPILDVLLMLPGDSHWAITFPNIVGSECLLIFADMCINAWSTAGGTQNQEVTRRHDLSDGFAVLAPRSQPKAIANYSTSALEIRNKANTVKIALSDDELALIAPVLSWNKTPTVSSTLSNASIPIKLNGVTYYIRLSTTP